MRGEPNPRQWEMYAQNNCVYHHKLPPSYQYMRNWNRGYMEWAQRVRIRRYSEPVVIQIYSEVLQKFRLAAQGKGAGRKPPAHLEGAHRANSSIRCRSTTSRSKRSRPISPAFRCAPSRSGRWRCITRGIRRTRGCARSTRTTTCSSIRRVARAAGIEDGGWMWVESPWGKVRCMASYSEAVEPGTVWTWNAIGKARGRVEPRARRERVAARLPAQPPDRRRAARRRRRAHLELGSDHRTGGLVRRPRAHLQGGSRTSRRRRAPQFAPVPAAPGTAKTRPRWQAFFAGEESERRRAR